MSVNVSEWYDEEVQSVDLATLDKMVAEMRELQDVYDAKKKESTEAHNKLAEKKAELVRTLQEAGKSKYFVDGLGTVSVVEKMTVRVPKDIESKRSLFNWIREAHGTEVMLDKLSIHSQTLNSFYNAEAEAALRAGHADFKMPGVEEPVAEYNIRFTKPRGG